MSTKHIFHSVHSPQLDIPICFDIAHYPMNHSYVFTHVSPHVDKRFVGPCTIDRTIHIQITCIKTKLVEHQSVGAFSRVQASKVSSQSNRTLESHSKAWTTITYMRSYPFSILSCRTNIFFFPQEFQISKDVQYADQKAVRYDSPHVNTGPTQFFVQNVSNPKSEQYMYAHCKAVSYIYIYYHKAMTDTFQNFKGIFGTGGVGRNTIFIVFQQASLTPPWQERCSGRC